METVNNKNEQKELLRTVERWRHETGFEVAHIEVFDESEVADVGYLSDQLDQWNDILHSPDEEFLPPLVHEDGSVTARNFASESLYQSPGVTELAKYMPGAIALYYLSHVDARHLPSGQPVDELMSEIVLAMDDAKGIRSRKRIASELIKDSLDSADGDTRCLSLACGAADLMLETAPAYKDNTHMTLVDYDPQALEFAQQIGQKQGLLEGADYTLMNQDLLRTMIADDTLVDHLGEQSQRVVEAIGINEYFPHKTSVRFLRNAYRLVEPGGSLITANMRDDRPQMEINKKAIGWPDLLYPRSVEELIAITEEAGLPVEQTEILLPNDGVYAVIRVKKPEVTEA